MGRCFSLSILSDVHYAGAAEQARRNFLFEPIKNPLLRLAIKLYRYHFWQRDPFAHNHLLDRFLDQTGGSDLVVANGDYSCDSAFVGVSDDAAYQSAAECLGKLRRRFGSRFQPNFGDHELGKRMMGGDVGGPRLASYYRAQKELGLQPFWQREVGDFVLLGVTSTLAALPVYEAEALPEERAKWRELREQHLAEVRRAFAALRPRQRILLFCHDPTALPFLWQEDKIREKLPQLERTIIGHLHSRLILLKSRLLAGMPVIRFLGHTPHRLSSALREARRWKPFKVLLCPSLAGIELLKDGGYCTAELDADAPHAVRFTTHRLRS
jgi:hypothetical protein